MMINFQYANITKVTMLSSRWFYYPARLTIPYMFFTLFVRFHSTWSNSRERKAHLSIIVQKTTSRQTAHHYNCSMTVRIEFVGDIYQNYKGEYPSNEKYVKVRSKQILGLSIFIDDQGNGLTIMFGSVDFVLGNGLKLGFLFAKHYSND